MFIKPLAAAALACVVTLPASAGQTFDAVKAKGFVQCAVNTGLAGFSFADSQGKWTGLDVDLCRAIAVAMFGDAEKVKFTPTTAQQRFVALQSGEVDVITRNATQTLLRDTSLGFNIAGVNFYDGQGFMVTAKSGLKSAKELNGATICVQPGTTTELNLADYFRKNKMTFKPVLIEKLDELLQAYASGRCNSYTTDASGLAAVRAGQLSGKGEHVILPERISKEPLGPIVRHGDDQWFDLVKWVLMGMIEARGARHQPEERRRDAEERRSGHQALPWRHAGLRQGGRRRREVDVQRHQADRELRRQLRPQRRQGHAAQARAWPERAVD